MMVNVTSEMVGFVNDLFPIWQDSYIQYICFLDNAKQSAVFF